MEELRKLPFMKKMASQLVPLRVRMELTRRCNLRCIHCKVKLDRHPAGEMTVDEIAALLDGLRAAGTMEISITGGEVFARPDITDVLRAILSRDFLLHIQTNGTAITREHIELLSRFRNRVQRVALSLYAADPNIHDAITRAPGSHRLTVHNILRLQEAGLPVFCFTLLMRENAGHAADLQQFYESHGLRHQFNTFIIPRDDGCFAPTEQRIPDEMLRALPVDWCAYLNPEGPENPAEFHAGATLDAWCPAARYAAITAVGDVISCSLLREPAGNVRERPFREIWETSPVLQRIRDVTLSELECFGCELFPSCKPCVGLAHLEHGDLRRKPSEMCRLSRALLHRDAAPNSSPQQDAGS